MIDRVTAKLGRRLYEAPVGFKWFVPGLLDGSVGMGGEESAGMSLLRMDGGDRLGDWFGGFITRYRSPGDVAPGPVPPRIELEYRLDHAGAVLDNGWIEETTQFIQNVTGSDRPRVGAEAPARAGGRALPVLAHGRKA